jgi:hypothetical protein
LEPEDSPSKQLFKEVNQLSIGPDAADDINNIPNKPKHSVSADFSVDNIIKGKQQRQAPRNVYAGAWIDGLKQFHSVFASFGTGLRDEAAFTKKQLH